MAHDDITELHANDLGGETVLSESQISLCRRAATLEVSLEQLEAKMSEGINCDLDLFNRLSGNLRESLLESLGLQRKSRDVPDDIDVMMDRVDKRRRISPDG